MVSWACAFLPWLYLPIPELVPDCSQGNSSLLALAPCHSLHFRVTQLCLPWLSLYQEDTSCSSVLLNSKSWLFNVTAQISEVWISGLVSVFILGDAQIQHFRKESGTEMEVNFCCHRTVLKQNFHVVMDLGVSWSQVTSIISSSTVVKGN